MIYRLEDGDEVTWPERGYFVMNETIPRTSTLHVTQTVHHLGRCNVNYDNLLHERGPRCKDWVRVCEVTV